MDIRQHDTENALVLIVDDDSEVRTSLQELFQSVDLETACFASTHDLVTSNLPDRPGCLVLDVRLPGTSGLDFHHRLSASGDVKPVIFLTGHGDIPMSVQAMKAGAIDFLTKPVRDQDLIDAVMAGIEKDLSQRRAAQAIKKYADRFSALTLRERQVLREVAAGRVNKQIAFDLGISEVTVKLHRSNVMRKMQAVTIGDLVRAWDALPAGIREQEPT